MPFFTFTQNNSGGSFHFDKQRGITHFVIIEANNSKEANALAEARGLYFDGVSKGGDCPCCGDRWYAVGEYGDDEGDLSPTIYGKPVNNNDLSTAWMEPGHEIAVHHQDGRIEWFGAMKVPRALGYKDEAMDVEEAKMLTSSFVQKAISLVDNGADVGGFDDWGAPF